MTRPRTRREGEQEVPQVMRVSQVAAYLQVSRRTIYTMAATGQMPAAKVGDQWRFYRPEIDRWLRQLSRTNVRTDAPRDDKPPDAPPDSPAG